MGKCSQKRSKCNISGLQYQPRPPEASFKEPEPPVPEKSDSEVGVEGDDDDDDSPMMIHLDYINPQWVSSDSEESDVADDGAYEEILEEGSTFSQVTK
jgi:hypothetical protein